MANIAKVMGVSVPPSGTLDIFDKFREFIPWVSRDGFTVGGDTGYNILPYGSSIYLVTGTTANYRAYLYSSARWWSLLDTGKKITTEFIITYLESITYQTIWLRFVYGISEPPSEVGHHFGWKLIGGDSVTDLHASNANATTQTITDTGINITAVTQRTRLKMVFTPTTDIKFYVNDVIVATHTTNLPTQTMYYLLFHVTTLTDAARGINLGRVLIEKEHA